MMKACDGCGKESDNTITLDDAEGNTVARVCPGRTYSRPSEACISKVIVKRSKDPKCLVCGEGSLYFSGAPLRPICRECDGLISQVKGERAARETYALPRFKIFGDPLPGNSHIDYDTIADAFTRAIAGDVRIDSGGESILPMRGFDSLNSGDSRVRLTPAQAEGVRDFVKAFAELVTKVAEAGRAAGGALLVQLARGEVSIDDFNDGQKPKRKR